MSLFRLVLLAVCLASVLADSAAGPIPPTIEQLAAFPKMSGFSVSPDGRHLVGLEARVEERVILVWRTDALSAPPTVIGTSKMKIQSVTFIKNDLLAVSLWQPFEMKLTGEVNKTFINKLYFTDLQGKEWREPLPLPTPKSDFEQRVQAISNPSVLDRLPEDSEHVLLINNAGLDAGDIYKVNVRTLRSERIQRAGEFDGGYLADRQGQLRARFKADVDATGAYVAAELRNLHTGNWDEHFRSYVKNRDQVQIVGFADDPNIAFLLSNLGKDKAVIYEYDIAARKQKELLFEHKFFEASDVIINPYSSNGMGDLIGVSYQGPRGRDVQWVHPQLQAIDQSLRVALRLKPNKTRFVDPATGESATTEYDTEAAYNLVSASSDFKTLVVVVDGAARPAEYYLLREGKLATLARAYPDIDRAALGQTSLVYYKARDGLDIPAFLTKPDAALCGPGPWASVVHPHGGPWARDGMDFDGSMWVPLMASRCYAVLQPQFRGSYGWGRKLWMAGDAEWGQKMQDDKDDGAKWLLDQKIAQSGRIAMFGFSYGGYSAFAAAIRPNGLYKCAIAGAGVSDIKKIWSSFYTNTFFRERQAPTVKGLNPVDHADQIKIPIMVYHGDRDRVVPLEQSEWYVERARKSGQPVEYHEIADYAHGPAWTRKIMGDQLRLIETYLQKGCGGSGL
jgi:pimeloyl-ACP methyl ester carboxylesterase